MEFLRNENPKPGFGPHLLVKFSAKENITKNITKLCDLLQSIAKWAIPNSNGVWYPINLDIKDPESFGARIFRWEFFSVGHLRVAILRLTENEAAESKDSEEKFFEGFET